MDLNLNQNQHTTIRLKGFTKAQKVGHFKQPPNWVLATEGIVTTEPSADGASCIVRSTDATGSTTLTVDDVDNPLSAPLTFNVTVAEAEITELAADADEPADN